MKRNEGNICLRKAKSKYYQKLLDENIRSPDRFWKVIKRIYPAENKQSLPSKSFRLTSDPTLITNGFANFYTEIVPKLKEVLLPLNSVIWRNGLDQLPPNLLKDAANEIAQSLTYIINLSLTTSTASTDWKKAKVSPIYKSGSTTELDNYRPISVLAIACKIMEREVYRHLYKFLDGTKLISKHQFGFQKKKSAALAAIPLLDQVRLAVANGNLVGACFIDLQKAFDTISHKKLISKLELYGVRDKARLV